MYSSDLAHIHDAGFGSFARDVAPQIAAILRRHHLTGGAVVEVGCGSGALAGHLSQSGFQVRGYDISRAMIRLARRKAPRVAFRVGSLATLSIPRCDAIVSVGEVVTYVPGRLRTLRRFFRRAYRALRPGGLLLFDFIESADGRTYRNKSLSGRGWQITVSARFNNSTEILTRRMALCRRVDGRTRRSRETHRVRVYSRAAIVAALERCGFSVKTGRSFGRVRLLARHVAVIARKSARV